MWRWSVLLTKNTKIHQILAVTINSIFGNQTFAISSGTSNCTAEGVAKIEKEKEIFIEVNFETLQKEIAQGTGETLNSFASLMGCNSEAQSTFAQTLQNDFENLNKIENGSLFITAVNTHVANNASLSKACSAPRS